jgi:hypothetical protein
LQSKLNALDSDLEDTDIHKEVAKNLKSEDRRLSKTSYGKRQKTSIGFNICPNIKSNSPNTNSNRKRYPSRQLVSFFFTYCYLIFAYTNIHYCCFSLFIMLRNQILLKKKRH